MKIRRDALVGASAVVQAVNRIGLEYQPGACATVGQMDVRPNSRNTIPGQVAFSVDLRHPDDASLSKMKAELETAAAAAAEQAGLDLDLREIWYQPPIHFDAACVDAVRQGAGNVDLPAMSTSNAARQAASPESPARAETLATRASIPPS